MICGSAIRGILHHMSFTICVYHILRHCYHGKIQGSADFVDQKVMPVFIACFGTEAI